MVEESDVLLDEYDAELLGRLVDGRVVLAPAWCRDVLGAGPVRAVDVVGEGELRRGTWLVNEGSTENGRCRGRMSEGSK